jgi:hypothetical protein
MKADGLLDRNWLKGALGDAMHAVLCGASHNLRMILAHLRVRLLALFGQIFLALQLVTVASRRQNFSSANQKRGVQGRLPTSTEAFSKV